jgi:transcription elongation factor GreB
MGRYRAPRPESSKYITPEGAARLRGELDELWRVKRPAVTKAVSEAAAQGDRSENAEYIYGKKQLAEIDRRVRFLRKRLTGIHVVDTRPSDPSKVYFGAWFEVCDPDGTTRRFRLVGPDESGFAAENISMDSPLGRAVIGKALDSEITVRTPEGETRYEIVAVRYEPLKAREKKPVLLAGRVTGGNRRKGKLSYGAVGVRPAYCSLAQLINRTSPDRRSKFRASSASMSFVS